jgi:Motility quorum-sensing regulator, toxin of MqsA
MVTHGKEVRDHAECALGRIQELAAQQSVIYGGRRVQNHIANLGYSLEAVCECLAQLTPDNFKQSERYSPDGPWHDVFLKTFRGPGNCDDDLYIKLTLDRTCVNIVLFSFHPEGAL